ncbi:MAG: hypothetical protein J6C92_07875 [Bacteroidaceae bacterium]|nr:hypothetical protein [Bacteroidaceae bacterium]
MFTIYFAKMGDDTIFYFKNRQKCKKRREKSIAYNALIIKGCSTLVRSVSDTCVERAGHLCGANAVQVWKKCRAGRE